MSFHGAKLAILSGQRIVTILRDDRPDIPWPGFWDLPGGGREAGETPEACILRETHEELGLVLDPSDLHWKRRAASPQGGHVWFFTSVQPGFDPGRVRFGNEGQSWQLAPLNWYLSHPRAIPHHTRLLQQYLDVSPR